MFYFLREDFEELNARIRKLYERIKKLGKEAGESCQEGAETWHDNFAFEESQRQQHMWSIQLHELIRIRNEARVIEPDPRTNKVSIGKVVTIQDIDTGEKRTFRIGSYRVFKKKEDVSYNAPLARILLGARVGEERKGRIGNREKRFRILKIE